MKRIVYIAAILILSAFGASAQSPTTTYPYLYDHFKDGVIIMSDGSQKAKQMNVHLRAGRLHYIDNGVIKEAFLADVSAVEIGKDVFLPVYSTLMLVVAKNDNGCVALQQLGDFEAAISGTGAYGTSASSSATMKLTSVQSDSQVNQNYMNILNEKSEGMNLSILSTYYLVTPEYKVKATRNEIQSVLPQEKAARLKGYVKEHKVKWKSPQGLLPLLDFLAE
jgi:hypothetical protein